MGTGALAMNGLPASAASASAPASQDSCAITAAKSDLKRLGILMPLQDRSEQEPVDEEAFNQKFAELLDGIDGIDTHKKKHKFVGIKVTKETPIEKDGKGSTHSDPNCRFCIDEKRIQKKSTPTKHYWVYACNIDGEIPITVNTAKRKSSSMTTDARREIRKDYMVSSIRMGKRATFAPLKKLPLNE